jgi:hypothetical protein
MRIYALILILFTPLLLRAQLRFSVPASSVPVSVFGLNGEPLDYPFAGGMNNCQYGQVDLNIDGKKDLVVFDRHGNRLLCFLNKGITGSVSYEYHPEFSALFPPLKEWMILKDYDNDGKEDIFTYTTGGIKVYRNISDSKLSFRQVSFPYLVSLQGSTTTNILVTYADYPAIADVDEDGDTDILTFKGLGSFIEWHKNTSMEIYGNSDSLVFERVSNCWGHFAEAGESNIIKLDTCYEPGKNINLTSDPKHTGSTLLLNDFSGNNLPDLLIGDVDFQAMVMLTNGGTLSEALMIAQTTDFPDSGHPVNLPSFPAACLVDVNNDQQQDLLVSGFDPGLLKTRNLNSSWLYLNNGEQSFQFYQPDFLQGQMLDFGAGAYPVFFDYNADGKMDLIVGNYGKLDTCIYSPQSGLQCTYIASLSLLENTGSDLQPSFKLVDEDFLGLSSLEMQSLIPAFGDLDSDGDQDLLCGNSKGKFVFLENLAGPSQPANLILRDPAFHQLDVGDFSAPQIYDLDGDGMNDIISGRRDGRLSYYRNTGSPGQPSFSLETDSLGGVDVTNINLSYFGYSVPFIYRQSADHSCLLVGSEFGEIYVFDSLRQNREGEFRKLGTVNVPVPGWRTAAAMTLLNNDTVPDLILGNYSGGLSFFEGFNTTLGESEASPLTKRLEIHPNPAGNLVSISLSGYNLQGNYMLQLVKVDAKPVLEVKDVKLPYVMDVSRLQQGVYLLFITGQGFRVSGKLMIMH